MEQNAIEEGIDDVDQFGVQGGVFGTDNRDLVSTRLSVYECPSAPVPHRFTGYYDNDGSGGGSHWAGPWNDDKVVATGDYMRARELQYDDGSGRKIIETALYWREEAKFRDITDGTSNTILLGETAGAIDPWFAGRKLVVNDPLYDWAQNRLIWVGPWASFKHWRMRNHSADGRTRFAGTCLINCNNTEAQPYPVSGRVIVNGVPAEGCTVALVPTDPELKGKVMPGGVTDEEGSFRLTTHETGDGAPAGEYQVTLRWEATKWPGMDDAVRVDPVKPEGPDRFQGRYARGEESGIMVTIEPEPNELEPFRLDDVALLPGSE